RRIASQIATTEQAEIFGTLMNVCTALYSSRSGTYTNSRAPFATISHKQIVTQQLKKNSGRDLRTPFRNQVPTTVIALKVDSLARVDPILVYQTQRLEPFIGEVQN